LRPHFVAGLNYATVSYRSPYGDIVSKWERKKKEVIYTVTVPANSTAELYLPEGMRVRKMTLAGDKTTLNLPKNAENGVRLAAGSYVFELY